MKIRFLAAAALIGLGSCASAYDPKEVLRRSAHLFGSEAEFEHGVLAPTSPELPPEALLRVADLDLALEYGLRKHAGLKAAFARWQAALERVPQVSSLPDPQLSFTQFIEDLETRTGPQERRYGVSQTLPWFGKLGGRADVANSQAEAAWHQAEAKRLEIVRDISVAYYEYAYLAEAIRIQDANLELLRQLEPVVQSRIQGGAGQGDLLRLQVEVGLLEDELASLRRVQPAQSARLAAAMSLDTDQVLPLPRLSEPRAVQGEAREWLRKAQQNNPKLRELAERMRGGEHALELSKLERYPDLTLGFDYLETDSAINSGTRGSGDDPYGVRVMFNLPIWTGRYRAAEREARSSLSAAGHERADYLATLRADIELEAYHLDDAGRQVALYRDSLLPRAREALEVTRTAYRTGSADLLAVIDSERALLGFETSYWRACRDQLQSMARLQFLSGGELR
ncbi:MAG: TolC family protein [Planctomycetota bacterium]|jgi:outer membrane protein TolC